MDALPRGLAPLLRQAAYTRSLSIKPSSSSHFNLGVVHFQTGDLPSSISSFQASLALSPDSADAHANLASAYIMSTPARPDLAVEHLSEAARLDPEDGEVQFNLGAVLEACERLEEALESYRRAGERGIERAEMNGRNVAAKILAAKAAIREQGLDKDGKEGEDKKKE